MEYIKEEKIIVNDGVAQTGLEINKAYDDIPDLKNTHLAEVKLTDNNSAEIKGV